MLKKNMFFYSVEFVLKYDNLDWFLEFQPYRGIIKRIFKGFQTNHASSMLKKTKWWDEMREHKCTWQKAARNEGYDISSNLVSW